jgi:hypothetical protein
MSFVLCAFTVHGLYIKNKDSCFLKKSPNATNAQIMQPTKARMKQKKNLCIENQCHQRTDHVTDKGQKKDH